MRPLSDKFIVFLYDGNNTFVKLVQFEILTGPHGATAHLKKMYNLEECQVNGIVQVPWDTECALVEENAHFRDYHIISTDNVPLTEAEIEVAEMEGKTYLTPEACISQDVALGTC